LQPSHSINNCSFNAPSILFTQPTKVLPNYVVLYQNGNAHLNEQMLITALQQGAQQAFNQLVEAYQHMVYNVALGIIQQQQEAEDIAQEVFIQVHQSIKDFKGEAKLSTWLYRITITKSLDWQRRKTRKKRFGIMQNLFGLNNEVMYETPEFYHPGVAMENKEQAAVLFKAISILPDNQKIAFTLNKVEGLSYQDVADVMNVTVASVEAYLHRAKENLRKQLTTYYTQTYK
jgi:RNA polymerase sigma factor (sigma-70 family)